MPERTTDTDTPPGGSKSWKKILFNRWLLAGVAALLIYTLLGFFLAPRLIKNYVTDFSQGTLKRKASIGEVRVNPFLFILDAKDFSLTELDGRPIVGFGRLLVDFELSSFFRWAWTFADIRLEAPSLHMEIEPDGRLNFAMLADSLPKTETESPPPVESQPPRLLVQHAGIIAGSFTFSDRSDITPATVTFQPLNLEFKEISTLPERKGPYTISADLPGGGTIGWSGEVSLHPLFSEGQLSITAFKLATAWKFAQDELRLAEPEGTINFRTSYRFEYLEHAPQLVLGQGSFEVKGLKLVEKGQSVPLLDLEAIQISGVAFDLAKQQVGVPEISVRNGKIAAAVNKKEILNWQTLVIPKKTPGQAAAVAPTAQASASQPWNLKVDRVQVENVAVDYKDNSRVQPLTLAVGGFNLSLNATAEVGVEEPRASLDNLQVKLSDVALLAEGDESPFLKLNMLTLDNSKVDIGNHAIQLSQLKINGGDARLIRGKEGQFMILEAFAPADPGMPKGKIAETGKKVSSEGKSWSFRLDSFELNGFETLVEDHMFPPAIKYNLQDIHVALKNISNDGKTPIDFDAGLKVAQGGNATFSGQMGQTGEHVDAKIKITGFSLKPLQPAVAKFTTLALKSGNISATANLKYQAVESGPQVRASGSIRVDRFRLNEAATNERVLQWRTLSASGLKFGLSPDRLIIKRVRLLKPEAKIMVYKDGSFNLAKAIKTPDTSGSGKPSSTPPSAPPGKGKKQPVFPVNIGSVRMEKGVVDFSDLSLVFPFATRIADFKGSVVDISSKPKSRSTVKFDGRVDKYGLATVDGSLSPFAPKDFTDLRVAFQNVEMQSFSPYSATFAGRKIASGVLNLNLGYKIQDSQLLGDNGVVLERFTLGERVDAPDAVSLPLDLAIALLSDANGVIDLAVPVRGNLDDPEFSYGHVIWKAFFNLITKIVTSPFRALGGLFGGGEEQVDAIGFNPGSDHLLPPEQQKLKQVVQALEKRPQLRLVVLGRFDPKIDGKALRTERVKRTLAAKMKQEIPLDEELPPVVFDKAKTQRNLEKLLETRSGDKAVAEFQTRYEKKTGKKAKRVNPALGLFGLKSPDTEFYRALFDELVKLEPLNEKPLHYLAQKRAETIAEDLKTTAGLDEARVAIGDSGPVEKPAKETIKTRLQLDVLPQAAK